MNKEKQRRVYTQNETCEMLSISRPTLADWARKGILQKITVPGQRRTYVLGDSIEKLLKPQK